VDVGDEGAVGGDCAGEDLALFEEADFADVAVEIVREHGDHAGDEGWAQERGLFGERVLHGDGCLRLGGVRSSFGRCPHLRSEMWGTRIRGLVEEVGVVLRGEGAGDGFAEAEGEEAGADGGFFGVGGLRDDDAGCGEGVGEAVVAVDAGDFFDEVDLALEVETPGGEFGSVDGLILTQAVEEEIAAKGGEVLGDDLRGDAGGVDGGAEVAFDLGDGELDGRTRGGAGFDVWVDEVDEFAFEFATVLEDELGDEGVGGGGGVEVGAALEAVGGVGVEAVAAGGAADAGGVEPCGFDEDVFGFGGDHGVPAAHDAGECEGLFFVGDDEVVGFEGAVGAVEEF